MKMLRLWAPVAAWCVLIFSLSAVPNLRFTPQWWDEPLRKMCHVGEYAILTWITWRANRGTWPGRSERKLGIWAAVFALAYAVSDEYHQSFVPTRGASVRDVVIDATGIAFAYWWSAGWKRGIVG